MARRRSRRLRFLWLGWGAVSAPAKLVALGLVAVLVGGVAADGRLGLPAGGEPGYAHGPAQRWGSASSADARTTGNPSRNHTLPDTLRSRYPAVKWQENAGSVGTPPAPATTGFDPAASRELPEARTANDRTYANPDGTETTEFSTVPVNYRTPQGWAPIDTTLTADGDSGWRNTADSAGLRFAPTSAGQFATMTVSSPDAGQVSFGLDGASAVNGTVSGSAITYPGVQPHVDLKLEAKPGGVKETLVLDSPAAPTSYVFPLRLDGLTPHLDHGQVLLADASGATKAVIPAGDMLDAGAARSAGVTYRLVTSGGGPALEVTLDAGWLRDPARHYPVQVDPTVQLPVNGGAADDAMYVQEGVGSAKGDQDLLVGTVNGHSSASYLKFSSLVGKLQYHTIFGAQLWLTEYNSDSCKPRELTVNPVTGSWSGGSGYSYPGPAVGGSLASKSFAHGYIAFGHSSSDCPTAGETINLGTAGRDLVQRWVDGTQANYGLSLRGSTDSLSGKWFTGTATANPPKLYVTHSPYNATYSIPNPVPNPAVLQNQDGKIKVAVTNKSAAAWPPGDYYLAYRAYNTATGASVTQQRSANLTSTVARGGRVTLDATIKALPPGKYFLDFTMVKTGGPVFTDHQVPPGRLVLQVFDIPPVVQELYPFNGYQAQTLTPQLWARALDIDAPPGSSLQFKFQVCLRDDSGNPVSCTDSGYQAKQAWTVPAGTLSWTKAYLWRAYVKDANNEVNSPYSTILTSVPQPDITSHLAGDQKQAFDPVVGNYSTAAVDATIVTVGPQLSLSRTYNSLDPRRDGLFGAGWSTTYDMKLVPDNDGSGNVVVTYPDGQQVRFGKNADGSYAAPAGRTASLTVDSTSWKLLDKSGTTYQFSPAGRLSRMTDNAGHTVVLTYDTNTGKLSKAQVSTSVTNTAGRALNFSWTGNHVSSIQTDAVNGAPLSWAYTYTGDVLKTVCGPGNTCTNYDYTAGSHYRSAVLDSHPESYWRLGEPDGTSAASEISVNLGKDVGTYANVTLGTAGPLAGSTDTAASFNGTTSSVNLPKGTLKKSRDAAVELWFKKSLTGSGGPLLGYQDKALGAASTTGVPVLYVGTDGKLRGQFATGSINPITSATAITDDKWHQVVLSSMGTTQTLYLDGAKVADLTGKQIDASLLTFNQVGAAYATTPASWPSWGNAAQRSFGGAIDDVSLYSGPLGAAIVAAHYKAGTTAADQLAKVTLPSGKVVASVTYDVVRDRVKEYTDHNGGTWKLGTPTVYGGDTDLRRSVEVLDPANRPSLYEYDAIGGWLLRQGKPLGIEARSEDTPGEPAETPPPPVESCTQPDPNDPAFCTTIPGDSGGPVFVRYDADGVSIRTYGYDSNGNLATVTDENGDATTMTYDARGDVVSTTTCRAVNDCQTSRTTYPATIANQYDPKSYLPTESRDARSASATDNTYRTTYAYHTTGQLTTQTSPDGSQITNAYTSGAEAAFGGGNVPAGLPATTTDARGKVTRYAHYANGDLAQVTAPSGLVTQYTYDAIGRTTTKKEISDSFPGGVVTTYTYDGWSRPATVTGAATTDAVTGVKHQQQTTTTYDADGDPIRVQVADIGGGGDPARVTTTDYDEHDRPIRVTDPDGNETSSGYDQFGNLTSVTDPNGNRYDYAYTARNSVAEVRLRNWHSDPAGAPPTGTGDYLVLQAYSYDFAGRLASSTDAMGRRTEYQRYGDGLLHRAVLKNFHNADGSTKDYVLEDDSYDAAGHLTKQVTGNGTTVTQHTPDRNGRPLSTVVDPGGLARTTGFTYDPAGNVTHVAVSGKASNVPWIVSATPATTDYTYDDAGNRLTMTTTDGTTSRTTTYAYDQRGLPTAVTDPRGNAAGADKAAFTSRLSYDELGRSIGGTGSVRQVESGGNPASPVAPTTKVGYNTFGETVEVTDELNNTTHVAYDNAGRMTSRTAPSYLPPGASQALTPTTRYEYDANGNVTTVTDPRGNVIRSTYDQLDRTVSVDAPSTTNDDRAVTSYTYSRTGAVLSTVDPTGARSESTYDDLDRQATGTQVERRPVPAAYTTLIRYDDAGNVVGQTSPTGATTVNGYDAVGELTTTTDPSGIPAQYGYDFAGRQVRATDGLGRTSQTGYDLLGQVVASADLKPDGTTLRTSRYGYDLAGNRTSVTDALQATRTFAYDAANQLVSQLEPVDAKTSITSSFGYDAAGNMTRFTDGRGNATITTYNSLGLVESTIEPATAAQPNAFDRTWTTGFDENGNAVRDVAPGGVVQQVTYDAANRPTDGTATGAETPTTPRHLGYDLAGRAVSTNAGAGLNSYVYNDRGNLLSSTGPSGTAAFAYDGDGNQTSRADAAGTTNYGYVKARLDSVTDGLTGVKEQLGYDGAGNVKTVGYGAGRVRTFGYDDFGRVATDVLTNSASKQVVSTTYHYDLNNQLSDKTTAGTAGAGTISYQYDQSGRLTSDTTGGVTTGYEWDAAGNRTKAGPATAAYDERNRLLTAGGTSYTYTARGTLASQTGSGGSAQFGYDGFDRLTAAPGQTYSYDGFDRVDSRNGTAFTYAGQDGDPVSDGSETYARGSGGELLAVRSGGSNRLTLSDRHDDVVGAFDPADTALNGLSGSTAYGPFGQVTAHTGTTGNLGYQGDWTDPGTGRVDMGARWYDPGTGSFGSRDSMSLSPTPSSNGNRYLYGNADPVNSTDPTGHWGIKFDTFDLVVQELKMLYNVVKPTRMADDSCEAYYGMSCAAFFRSAHKESVHDMFCDTHPWTGQCGGSGRSPYSWGGGGGGSHGGGGGNGGGGGGGGSYVDWAKKAAEEAAEAAYRRALRLTEEARDAAEHAAKTVTIAVGAAATTAVTNLPTLVSSAPTAAAAVVSTVENVVTDTKAQAKNIYQAAVDAAGAVVTVVSTASQVNTEPENKTQNKSRQGRDCRQQFPEPFYFERDSANGDRAVGVIACVTKADLGQGTGTTSSIRPPGYQWAISFTKAIGGGDPRAWVNNCHSLASVLGGSGTDLRNLSTCSRSTNASVIDKANDRAHSPNMRWFEDKTEKELKSGKVDYVLYTVIQHYHGPRTVPYEYDMNAEGADVETGNTFSLHKPIENKVWSPKYHKWMNMGEGIKDGNPVPVGSTP